MTLSAASQYFLWHNEKNGWCFFDKQDMNKYSSSSSSPSASSKKKKMFSKNVIVSLNRHKSGWSTTAGGFLLQWFDATFRFLVNAKCCMLYFSADEDVPLWCNPAQSFVPSVFSTNPRIIIKIWGVVINTILTIMTQRSDMTHHLRDKANWNRSLFELSYYNIKQNVNPSIKQQLTTVSVRQV